LKKINKTITLIPARGGSKGMPKKNIIDLNGKPLIAYTIEASIKSKSHETWVSTDDDEIADVARKYGAKISRRPKNLSLDETTSESVLLHFAEENPDFDILVFLQCTVPLIEYEDINNGIDKMKYFDSVVSVTETNQKFWDSNGPLYDINNRKRRQDSFKRYLETGSIFITTKKKLIKSKNRLSGKIGFVETPNHRSIDIDDYNDLKMIKAIIRSKEFDNE
jgi:CMP-N,N'-diacetyllegionaminic acid synthase|tara:strand:+ start:1431 stop:2093 length:663 start_codon:yes stop_codon:yes gene_type:complete